MTTRLVIETTVLSSTAPERGQLVEVRRRQWIVPEERERERLAIEDPHTGLVDHTFPVAVVLRVPESQSSRSSR